MLKTEVIKFARGGEVTVMREALAKGKKLLKEEGYQVQANPLFYKKGNTIVYYSKSMKAWIVEETKKANFNIHHDESTGAWAEEETHN